MVRAVIPDNIMAGCRTTGISPVDANIFQDSDFLPAYVTDCPAVDSNEAPSTSGAMFPASPSQERMCKNSHPMMMK